MSNTWSNNNTLHKFTENKGVIRVECTFKEFINSPFFEDFDKPVKDNKWLFGNGSDKMLIFDEEEMYDSWTMVSLYLNDSKRPTATLLADNIQSVRLTLNLGDGPTYLEIFSGEVPKSLEKRLTRSGYILFYLSEEMVQALKNNYNDYYEDYFPDLNKPYEDLEESVDLGELKWALCAGYITPKEYQIAKEIDFHINSEDYDVFINEIQGFLDLEDIKSVSYTDTTTDDGAYEVVLKDGSVKVFDFSYRSPLKLRK